MEKYAISQTPEGPQKSSRKKSKSKKAANQRASRTIDPKMALIAVAALVILILGGVAWAHFINNKTPKPVTPGNGSTAAKPVVPQVTLTSVTAAVESKNLSDLESLYAKNVKVVVLKTSTKKTVNGKQVTGLIANSLNSIAGNWNWHPSASQISDWQQGPYGEYFGDNTTIGISDDGTVISIHYDDDGHIDTVFIAPVEDLTPPADQGGGGSTDTGGGSDGGTSNPSNPTTPNTTFTD